MRLIKEQRAENNHSNSFHVKLPNDISDFADEFEPYLEFQATEVENKSLEEMGFIRNALKNLKI